jgi:RimJ/RimL family protein N-acetyltransferase
MAGFQIRTARLTLRPWTDDDVQPFTEMVLDRGFADHMIPLSGPEAAREWVRNKRARFDQHGFGPWVVERSDTSEFFDCVGLSVVPYEADFTRAAEIGWRIARPHRERGYATEAAMSALGDGSVN